MEIWVNIKGFEEIYQVSDLGNVRRKSRIVMRSRNGALKYNEREISQWVDKYGYMCVSLQCDRKRLSKTVHSLVMQAFSNEEPKQTINHKNGIKKDNRYLNLEWATIKENIDHAIKNGLRGTKEKSVCKLKDGIVIEIYNSIKIAAEMNNISRASIISYCKGKRNSKSGFSYKYSKKIKTDSNGKRIN